MQNKNKTKQTNKKTTTKNKKSWGSKSICKNVPFEIGTLSQSSFFLLLLINELSAILSRQLLTPAHLLIMIRCILKDFDSSPWILQTKWPQDSNGCNDAVIDAVEKSHFHNRII